LCKCFISWALITDVQVRRTVTLWLDAGPRRPRRNYKLQNEVLREFWSTNSLIISIASLLGRWQRSKPIVAPARRRMTDRAFREWYETQLERFDQVHQSVLNTPERVAPHAPLRVWNNSMVCTRAADRIVLIEADRTLERCARNGCRAR
jgi:hypothetical protein